MYSWNTTISSSLTTNHLIYDRTHVSGEGYYYELYDIRVSLDGYYVFASRSSMDTYGYLYSDEFQSNSPYTNLMEMDDEAGGLSQFKVTGFLESGKRYVLVVTTYYKFITGNYQLIASGPFTININKLNGISSTFTTTMRK
jgi:hypothetical protein